MPRAHGRRFALVTAAALVAGCPDRTVSELDPVPSNVEEKQFPVVANRAVDLLFVIDNSDSMADEQASLRTNFGRFIDVLGRIRGGLPDVHIGVATSDMGSLGVIGSGQCAGLGDAGRLHVGSAVIAGGARYLSDVADPVTGARITNYDQGGTVSLTTAFGQIGEVGTAGCPFEQHLAGMRAALESPDNAGFLRPDAHLAVIVLADEDDCSAEAPEFFGTAPELGQLGSFRCFEYGVECAEPDPRAPGPRTDCRPRDPSPYITSPDAFADFLAGVKPFPDDLVVAAIVGDPASVRVGVDTAHDNAPTLEPSCTYDNPDPAADDQSADPAIRLTAFVDRFGTRGQRSSICATDLSGALEQVGDLVANNLDGSCIRGELGDADPTTPAPDYECSVRLVSAPAAVDPLDEVVPTCATAPAELCWVLVAADRCSAYPTGLALEIRNPEGAPAGARIAASCLLE